MINIHPNQSIQSACVKQCLNNITSTAIKSYIQDHFNYSFISSKLLVTNGMINFLYLIEVFDRDHKINQKILLKVNNPHPMWKFVKTQNQANILKYLKSKTTIPVPSVIAYCSKPQETLLNCEFILMEYIQNDGDLETFIIQVWNSNITQQQKCDIFKSLLIQGFSILKQIYDVRINKLICGFGENMKPMPLTWDGPTIGPYEKLDELLIQTLEIGIQNLMINSDQIKEITQFIQALKRVIVSIKNEQDLNSLSEYGMFRLRHGDLHNGNISIKNATINGIYDWQHSRNGLWHQHERQYDLTQKWFSNICNKEIMNELNKFQDSLIIKYEFDQIKQSKYEKYFKICYYCNWSWFYVITWWRDCEQNMISKMIENQRITNLKLLKQILVNEGFWTN